jgi:hypothetical protein
MGRTDVRAESQFGNSVHRSSSTTSTVMQIFVRKKTLVFQFTETILTTSIRQFWYYIRTNEDLPRAFAVLFVPALVWQTLQNSKRLSYENWNRNKRENNSAGQRGDGHTPPPCSSYFRLPHRLPQQRPWPSGWRGDGSSAWAQRRARQRSSSRRSSSESTPPPPTPAPLSLLCIMLALPYLCFPRAAAALACAVRAWVAL